MAETPQKSPAELLGSAMDRLKEEIRAQQEQVRNFEKGLQELRERQQGLIAAVEEELQATALAMAQQFDELEALKARVVALENPSLGTILGSVRNLITATLPEQVFHTVVDESAQMGVRAAVFDVRGKAAWGASASGFGPSLAEKTFRGLAVPLSQEGPFRQVYDTGGHVDTDADGLKRYRTLGSKLRPEPQTPILLLPIRSAGSVSAIFYADLGASKGPLPVEALKILTEFAGAQLDRLLAFGAGSEAAPARVQEIEPEVESTEEAVAVVEEPKATEEAVSEAVAAEAASASEVAVAEATVAPPTESAPFEAAAPEVVPVVEEAPLPPPAPVVEEPAKVEAAPPAVFDISQLSDAEQRVHRDAKRFAKLLVSEIELYNKAKVADGRKKKDLYSRLKSDIDRSRQTFEKRFGKSVGKQVDYFHEELVKTLASNDPELLGLDYPGASA